MRKPSEARTRIAEAASRAWAASGLSSLTVASVARKAGVSSALVHYHFETKRRLVAAGASRLLEARVDTRLAALSARSGLSGLDSMWRAIEENVASGDERALGELVALAPRDREVGKLVAQGRSAEHRALATRLPRLLSELGAAPAAESDDLAAAVRAALDGFGMALVAGEDAVDVRAAYDAFWLALIAAHPRGAAR